MPTFSIFAFHDKVKHWLLTESGLTEKEAAAHLALRQERIGTQPCRFLILPDGETPGER